MSEERHVASLLRHGQQPRQERCLHSAAEEFVVLFLYLSKVWSVVLDVSFLPAIVSTSTRMHGEFLRLFLQAHRETEAHFTAVGMSSQNINTEALRFKRAAFYNCLKSKVGLAAAKAAALRININVQGCGIVASSNCWTLFSFFASQTLHNRNFF